MMSGNDGYFGKDEISSLINEIRKIDIDWNSTKNKEPTLIDAVKPDWDDACISCIYYMEGEPSENLSIEEVHSCIKSIMKMRKRYKHKLLKSFQSTWVGICTNVDKIDVTDEKKRAFYIKKCTECDPNSFENLKEDVEEKLKNCINDLNAGIADKRKGYKNRL